MPYSLYSDHDIAHRTLYVEASRGCPFKCEFCLSALDKTAWPFALDTFLGELEALHARGARLFKFVDRTFNLNIKTSLKIMQFFLDKLAAHPDDPVYAHFELVPDHLPDALIAGLPGEDVASFARGFDQLVALKPHEIQFGILKRLRGTPIIRHTDEYGLVFDPYPPYTILATRDIDFSTMLRLVRFARYWDLVANSGRFVNTLEVMLGEAPFANFMAFSDWIYTKTDATHRIALDRLANLVAQWLQARGMDAEAAAALVGSDYAGNKPKPAAALPQRQARHLAA